jgi:hypothetical protein
MSYLASLADRIARAAAQAPDPQTGAIDAAQAEVQRMLAEGRPLAEVYAVASRALALTLSGGLSPDRQRAWQMLHRTLREGSAEAGKIPPLERHPDWGAVVELLLDAVDDLPGGPAAVLAAVRRASTVPSRKAAA